jgi:hypothetical protein
MTYYYSVRGWLEIDPDNFTIVVDKIQALENEYLENTKLALYMKGWCWSKTPINWSRYLFYGADVSSEGLDLLKNVINEITNLHIHVSGFFHAQGEDSERNFVYKVVNDYLSFEEAEIIVEESTEVECDRSSVG